MPNHNPTDGDIDHWDEMYAGEQRWSGNPNEALIAEVADLTPGRVLDVGCGEGADAVWLATHGWDVTALDISRNAVQRTQALAAEHHVTVTGLAQGVLEADLAVGSFDLVSAMYPPLLRTADKRAEQRLLDLVAPGGHLLLVHHVNFGTEKHGQHHDHGHGHGDGRPQEGGHRRNPADYVAVDEVEAYALEQGGWEVLVSEHRGRNVRTGAGAHHTDDHIVHLRKLS